MEHTKGKWEIGSICDWEIWVGADCHIADVHGDIPTRQANARLIAEAGTVANETGLTPRQLAEQRAELLEAAERYCRMAEEMYKEHDEKPTNATYWMFKDAIAKIEGKEGRNAKL